MERESLLIGSHMIPKRPGYSMGFIEATSAKKRVKRLLPTDYIVKSQGEDRAKYEQ